MNASERRRRAASSALVLGLAALLLTASACLEPGKSDYVPREYTCSGLRCVNSVVGRRSPSSSEEADPGSGCHVTQLGRCADGCMFASTEVVKDVPGCPVAYACKSWERVVPGTACETRLDCEPGLVDGVERNTLDCVQGRCEDVGEEKWSEVPLEPVPCDGKPYFGPHVECGGAACLSRDFYERPRYCSVARCLDDGDCPDGWSCRCLEERVEDELLKAWRWCVPIELPDAGAVPGDAGSGAEDAGSGTGPSDGGEPADAGSPDAG